MTEAEGKLWGARFSAAPDVAAWALGRSVHFDARLWAEDLTGSLQHAAELRRVGLLNDADHAGIVAAVEAVRVEFGSQTFVFREDDEDLHGAVERRLIELAGEAGQRLRAGRSRNDQISADLRRYLVREIGETLLPAVRELQLALGDRADETADWPAPGYTHLQRAQPVTLGHHLLAHAWALDRDAGRLADAAERMAVSTLTSGALAGQTLGLNPESYLAEGERVADNSMDAVADRDFAVEFLAAAAMLGVHLSRLGEEIVLWSSVEFAWARVGDAFSTGSSIMPQKRNPDVAELVRGKTGRLIGDLVSLLVTLKGLPLTYNRDLQEDKEPVFDAVDTLRLSLPAMAGTVRSLAFDRARLSASAGGGFALATDVAEELVRRGLPFRMAHERVGAVVSSCEAQGIDIADMEPDALVAALPELDGADIADLLSVEGALRRRNATQGTAPDSVRAQLERLRARLTS